MALFFLFFLQTKQEYNGLQDFTKSEERTAWLRLWGHEQGGPRKTHVLYSITEGVPGFFFSGLYRYTDNKLFAVTVPDRHDLTWLNIMNLEDFRCIRRTKQVRGVRKHAARGRNSAKQPRSLVNWTHKSTMLAAPGREPAAVAPCPSLFCHNCH